jgi:hypothetical protein
MCGKGVRLALMPTPIEKQLPAASLLLRHENRELVEE